MQDLIKIFTHSIGGHKVNAVNARDVWEILGSKQHFSDWIKNRIEIYDEGFDYIRILSISESNLNLTKNMEVVSLDVSDTENLNCVVLDKDKKFPGKKSDYIITLQTAKEFALMERNEKGKEMRRYLIEFEEKGKIELKKLRAEIKKLRLEIETFKEEIIRLTAKIKVLNESVNLLKQFEASSKNTIKIYESMLRAKTIDDEIKELENIKQKLKDEGYYHK
ncbi:antA/AntB antirepressor family protein [Campylobacter corcagiensis]|uniref:AntA/AntB antirepressor family protein n=1 Tax=Campylobacter corcagiensis TaxID=1448857 RepID=A0A6M8N5F9_9BACT|nr:antA/AntB antirepressor family protein [Campylobacter corcagiensis]QKF65555.1 AntA/AntB family antirepressor [Campylobacter corcagiensis]QOQ86537.1 antA/AntB antirepressor family protein [Campylobacter corcagiensis]